MTNLSMIAEKPTDYQPKVSNLVTYAEKLRDVPIDSDRRVTLERMVKFLDELNRSGLPATLHVSDVKNRYAETGGTFETTKVTAALRIAGLAEHDVSSAFKRERFPTGLFASALALGIVASGLGAGMAAAAIGGSVFLSAGVVSLGLPASYFARWALKKGSFQAVHEDLSDAAADRPLFSEYRNKLLWEIAHKIETTHDKGEAISFTAHEMTPALKDITRHLLRNGCKFHVVLPGAGNVLMAPQCSAPPLGEIVEQMASTVRPRAADAVQARWAGGLAQAFNRLADALSTLDAPLQEQAKPLLDVLGSVQILCSLVPINNARIGKLTHELNNVTDQIERYNTVRGLGMEKPGDVQNLTEVFSVKAHSIAQRFASDLGNIRAGFEVGLDLLKKDLV